MFKHILIATDGSEPAWKAIEAGLALAQKLNAAVTGVTVTEPWMFAAPGEVGTAIPVEAYDKAVAANAARILAPVTKTAERHGVACETVHVKGQSAEQGIVDTAKTKGCDLIVMASHGRRGLAKLFLGSQAIKVLTLSPVPVLICR